MVFFSGPETVSKTLFHAAVVLPMTRVPSQDLVKSDPVPYHDRFTRVCVQWGLAWWGTKNRIPKGHIYVVHVVGVVGLCPSRCRVYRGQFANNATTFLDRFSFDGTDIDWYV